MNNFQILDVLKGYPVTVCSADQVRVKRGQFVIANTQRSNKPGEHWVVFYFPEEGPNEFFDSLGHAPEFYRVHFEKNLRQPYYMTSNRIQDFKSDTCGLYCIYYVVNRYSGITMQTLMNAFDINNKKENDILVVERTRNIL